ncbi:MAG: hypothetical protein ABJF65_00160 [Reichenbachiella sp.]|uniref:hypothetical protein n=1 Tax=Reichenbachiella sp. TaxID=2184521 RepID=UPI0032646AE4
MSDINKEDAKYYSLPTSQAAGGKTASIIFGPSGKGKSVTGDIIEKLNKEGLESLSPEEREVLDRLNKSLANKG